MQSAESECRFPACPHLHPMIYLVGPSYMNSRSTQTTDGGQQIRVTTDDDDYAVSSGVVSVWIKKCEKFR